MLAGGPAPPAPALAPAILIPNALVGTYTATLSQSPGTTRRSSSVLSGCVSTGVGAGAVSTSTSIVADAGSASVVVAVVVGASSLRLERFNRSFAWILPSSLVVIRPREAGSGKSRRKEYRADG